MAFSTPTMPIRGGAVIAGAAYSPVSDVRAVVAACADVIAEPCTDSTFSLVSYVINHPLLTANGLSGTWGGGNPPVFSGGGGPTRPSSGFLYPRGDA